MSALLVQDVGRRLFSMVEAEGKVVAAGDASGEAFDHGSARLLGVRQRSVVGCRARLADVAVDALEVAHHRGGRRGLLHAASATPFARPEIHALEGTTR